MEIVGANNAEYEERAESALCERDIHIGVFFDGTNNNANNGKWTDWLHLQGRVDILGRNEENRALNNTIDWNRKGNISNPAILAKLFRPLSHNSNDKVVTLYIEGVGREGFMAENSVADFVVNGKPVIGLGFGLGSSGVVAKVSKAVQYIYNQISIEIHRGLSKIRNIHFYVFGFSRGATCARLLSYLIAREEGQVLPREHEFNNYLAGNLFTNGRVSFLDEIKQRVNSVTVDFLGVYDTVSAMGFLNEQEGDASWRETPLLSRTEMWSNFHRDNARNYGLYSQSLDNVKSSCHICALDEFRANFAITDFGESLPANSIELFIPGCHSDIGGGYGIDDDPSGKSLAKYTSNGVLKNKVYTRMCVGNPIVDGEWEYVSGELLQSLGWVDDENREICKETDKEVTIKHWPNPQNQYSNISLKFMYDRATMQTTQGPDSVLTRLFATYPTWKYPLPKDVELSAMWGKLSGLFNKDGRYCYMFGNKLTSNEYRRIRQKYLHFSCSDSLHEAADVGNEPGRRHNGFVSDLCRYVYRGNESDNSIHYMFDYKDMVFV